MTRSFSSPIRHPARARAEAAQRRDLRQGLDAPEVARHVSHKDLIHHCKGHVGEAHHVTLTPGSAHECQWGTREVDGSPQWVKLCEADGPCEPTPARVACDKCGLDGTQLPYEAIVQVDPCGPTRKELSEELCQKGHVYGWFSEEEAVEAGLPILNLPELGWGLDSEHEYHFCSQCGELGHVHAARPRRVRESAAS